MVKKDWTAADWYEGCGKTLEKPPPEKMTVSQASSGWVVVRMEVPGLTWVAPTLGREGAG